MAISNQSISIQTLSKVMLSLSLYHREQRKAAEGASNFFPLMKAQNVCDSTRRRERESVCAREINRKLDLKG